MNVRIQYLCVDPRSHLKKKSLNDRKYHQIRIKKNIEFRKHSPEDQANYFDR